MRVVFLSLNSYGSGESDVPLFGVEYQETDYMGVLLWSRVVDDDSDVDDSNWVRGVIDLALSAMAQGRA